MKATRKTLSAVIFCLAVILMAGCAVLSSLTAKPEPLEKRVEKYMQSQVDKKWDVAYTFFDSSTREKITKESYVNRNRKLSYKGFAIEEITVFPSGDQATVKVRIDLQYMGHIFPRAPRTQNWVREEGAWFVKQSSPTRKTPFTMPEKAK